QGKTYQPQAAFDPPRGLTVGRAGIRNSSRVAGLVRVAHGGHQDPSSGICNTVPHALQCTASASWRISAQVGQRKRTLGGCSSTRTSIKKSVTPRIMMTIEMKR